jgi:hypothetical protein
MHSDRVETPSHAAMAGGPLAGLRVLEFGQIAAAPFAGSLLADLGTDVVGAAVGSVQFCRSVGAAFRTAAVGAVLFAVLMAMDPDAARLFGGLVEQGPSALVGLPAARRAVVQAEVADAFRAAFPAMAGFACGSLILAWSIPVRRI